MNPIPMNEYEREEARAVEALKALAAHDAPVGASSITRQRVMTEFRARKVRHSRRNATLWVLATAAALIVTAVALRIEAPQNLEVAGPVMDPKSDSEQPPLEAPTVTAQAKPAPGVGRPESGSEPKKKTIRKSARPVLARRGDSTHPADVAIAQGGASQDSDVVTEFFPLVTPVLPFERGQLLRVNLPASAMQMVGFPVREDRMAQPVQADVLVGEEGIPRAIRFVKANFK
jgi:hypothetical protein